MITENFTNNTLHQDFQVNITILKKKKISNSIIIYLLSIRTLLFFLLVTLYTLHFLKNINFFFLIDSKIPFKINLSNHYYFGRFS